jgi:hypothetical protein
LDTNNAHILDVSPFVERYSGVTTRKRTSAPAAGMQMAKSNSGTTQVRATPSAPTRTTQSSPSRGNQASPGRTRPKLVENPNCGCKEGQKPCPNQRCAGRPSTTQAQAEDSKPSEQAATQPEQATTTTNEASTNTNAAESAQTPSGSSGGTERKDEAKAADSGAVEKTEVLKSYWFWGVIIGATAAYFYAKNKKVSMLSSVLIGAGVGGAAGYGLEVFYKPGIMVSEKSDNQP